MIHANDFFKVNLSDDEFMADIGEKLDLKQSKTKIERLLEEMHEAGDCRIINIGFPFVAGSTSNDIKEWLREFGYSMKYTTFSGWYISSL